MTELDRTGSTVGRWSVLGKCAREGYWLCRCSCRLQTERELSYVTLDRRGDTACCGCIFRESRREAKAQELVGKAFGRLTVIGPGGQTKVGAALWACKCECGNDKLVETFNLKSGRIASCGCLQKESQTANGVGKIVDRTGQRFGRLVAIELAGKSSLCHALWLCKCDCGNEKVVLNDSLQSGRTLSCGCYSVDINRELKTTHGLSHTVEHSIWQSMIDRCYNKNANKYKNYGKRGISVCERWLEDFENFYEDMGVRPDGLTLDRIDVNGNYCKENCRWATNDIQKDNRQNTIRITHNGETLTLSQWARKLGVRRELLYHRIVLNGWTPEEALTTEKFKRRNVTRKRDDKYQSQVDAAHAVSVSLREGHLQKLTTCEYAGCEAPAEEAHHYMGYARENWLDVQWLCKNHHARERAEVVEFNGKVQTIEEWADELGIGKVALKARLNSPNWTKEEALTTRKLAHGNSRGKSHKRRTRRTGPTRKKSPEANPET